MASPAPVAAKPIALLPASIRCRCGGGGLRSARPALTAAAARLRVMASASASDVPDFLSSDWLETRKKKPFGPRLNFNAEEAVEYQLESLKYNDQPRQDYGIEVMYRVIAQPWELLISLYMVLMKFPLKNGVDETQLGLSDESIIYFFNKWSRCSYESIWCCQFAGFDPFERSTYFGRQFDLGQFERFRRLFHHSTYRVLLGHKERKILSRLWIEENLFKQRIWVRGARPEEEGIFQFTMIQRIGGSWDGYWLTESLINDGDAFSGGVAY